MCARLYSSPHVTSTASLGVRVSLLWRPFPESSYPVQSRAEERGLHGAMPVAVLLTRWGCHSLGTALSLGAQVGCGPHTPDQVPCPACPSCLPLGLNKAVLGNQSSQAIWGAASIFILDLGSGGPAQPEMSFKGSSALALQPVRP